MDRRLTPDTLTAGTLAGSPAGPAGTAKTRVYMHS